MKYIRTQRGLIFYNAPEASPKEFIYDNRLGQEHKDTVICEGETLQDLIQVGDLIDYSFTTIKEKRKGWLKCVTKSNVKQMKDYNLVINQLYVKGSSGADYLETMPKDYKLIEKYKNTNLMNWLPCSIWKK